MNLHGYKKSHKNMARMIKHEEKNNRCQEKIERLKKCKSDCAKTIRILKKSKRKEKRVFRKQRKK